MNKAFTGLLAQVDEELERVTGERRHVFFEWSPFAPADSSWRFWYPGGKTYYDHTGEGAMRACYNELVTQPPKAGS